MVQVKTAQTQLEIDRILRFRYQIEIEELGKAKCHADHARRVVTDGLDNSATHVYAEVSGNIVGALRRNEVTAADVPNGLKIAVQRLGFEQWGSHRLVYNSRFMVASSTRGSAMFTELLQRSYEIGRDSGMLFEFLYCRPALTSLYERVGFRLFGDAFFDSDGLEGVPMVMAVPRTERLRDHARPVHNHPESVLVGLAMSWLNRQLPETTSRRRRKRRPSLPEKLCVDS